MPTAERDAAHRAVDLRADVPQRPRADVQLAGRTRDDPGRRRQQPRSLASSSESARKCPRTRSRTASGRSTTSAVRSPCTSAGSTRTRAAGSCSLTSARICKAGGAADAGADWQFDSRDSRFIRASAISGSSTTATSSTRSPASELLIMPSFFESLSMVALEAWALGRPVLANAKCDVLKGSVFAATRDSITTASRSSSRRCRAIELNRWIASQPREKRATGLPRQLRLAGHRAQVPRHARACLRDGAVGIRSAARVAGAAQADCPPAAQVVAAIPAGPSVAPEMSVPRRQTESASLRPQPRRRADT